MNNRTEQFHFFATPEEAKLIRDREKEIGILNESAYLRKMAIDGYLIQMDLSDVKEAVRLLGITSSNMNQYAKNELSYNSYRNYGVNLHILDKGKYHYLLKPILDLEHHSHYILNYPQFG